MVSGQRTGALALSLGDYCWGLACFAIIVGSAAATATLVVRARYDAVEREARVVAWGVIAAGALALAALAPLTLGLLSRGTVIAASLLLLAAASRVRVRRTGAGAGARRRRPGAAAHESSTSAVVAFGAVAVAAVYVIAFLIHVRNAPIGDYDSTSFILPVPSRWIQTGSLWHFDDLVPGWGYGAYPQTGSLFQLAALLPWHNDFALRLVNVPFMALAAAAGYALACELGAARPHALTCAAAAVMLPATAAHALDHAQTDVIMAAGFTAGALFLARHARTRSGTDLLLAGVALGLSFGIKWYAGPEIGALLAVWAVGCVAARRGTGPLVRDGLVVIGLVALLGGIWLVRNLAVGGNPLFPARVALLGATIFPGPAHTAGDPVSFSIAHYATDASVLRKFLWPAYRTSFGLSGLLIALGMVAAVLRVRASQPRLLLTAAAAFLAFLVYTAMPYSALGPSGHPSFITAATRYSGAPLILAGTVAACGLTLLGRAPALVAQAVLTLAMALTMTHYDNQVGSVRFDVPAKDFAAAAVALAIGAGMAVAAARGATRPLLVAAAAILLAALSIGARRVEQSFNSARYRGVNPAFDWVAANSGHGRRIALTGQPDRDFNAAPYISFGSRLQNRVTFIGPRASHLLTRYDAAPPFVRALRSGRYDALLVGWEARGRPRELAWALSAGWVPAASGGSFTLLRPPGADVQG